MCISILPSADFWITTPFYLKAKCSTASFARNTDPAKHICGALWVLVREGTFLVGVNFLQLPFLKVRINMFECWQLQIKMSHQKKNPCYIKFLISYWLESSSRRNEKCWTWFHEHRLFFSYKQENKPSCLQNKCNYFLTSSNLVISRVINLLEEKKKLHWIFISHRKAPYMSKKVWGNISDINILTHVNQILSISKWLNYLA